jgi:hypothetical protein
MVAPGERTMANDLEATLEARYPGFRGKEVAAHGGLAAYVVEQSRRTERSPVYMYGHAAGEDVEHFFHHQLLVVSDAGASPFGYVVVHFSGFNLVSDRYDQHSFGVSYEVETGATSPLHQDSYYQKYGGRSTNTDSPLAPLLEHLKTRVGLTDLTEEQLAAWLKTMSGRYGG